MDERDLDESLNAEDLNAINTVVLPASFDDPAYDDSPAGDVEDDEDEIIEDDGEDDPDADLDIDPIFTEDVDYGEQEEL